MEVRNVGTFGRKFYCCANNLYRVVWCWPCFGQPNIFRQVWRKRLHHLATPDLHSALEACVAALEAMDRPDTTLLCSVYEGLARALASPSSATAAPDGAKAEELCLRAITALDRPDNKPQGPGADGGGAGAGAGTGGGKGAGGAKGAWWAKICSKPVKKMDAPPEV